jgi:type IV pilus assembly protein PilC
MLYSYQARDMAGNIFKGNMEADSRSVVVQHLLGKNYVVIDIKEEKGRSAARQREVSLDALKPVKTRDLAIFTRQLSTMIGAGIPIIRCFSILAEQTQNPNLKKAALKIGSDLEGGAALWEALGHHRAIFSAMFVHMVKSGEAGGVLDGVLARLAENLEREEEIKQKVRSASVYPLILMGMAATGGHLYAHLYHAQLCQEFYRSGAEAPRLYTVHDGGQRLSGPLWPVAADTHRGPGFPGNDVGAAGLGAPLL